MGMVREVVATTARSHPQGPPTSMTHKRATLLPGTTLAPRAVPSIIVAGMMFQEVMVLEVVVEAEMMIKEEMTIHISMGRASMGVTSMMKYVSIVKRGDTLHSTVQRG